MHNSMCTYMCVSARSECSQGTGVYACRESARICLESPQVRRDSMYGNVALAQERTGSLSSEVIVLVNVTTSYKGLARQKGTPGE